MSSSKHHIVIIGGNFAGIGTSHYILRHIIPSLTATTSKNYKLTLISPSTQLFWKIGAPRAISQPAAVEKSFAPFADAFKTYGDLYCFVHGKATGLDKLTRAVTVEHTDGKESTVFYNSLVIATGTTSNSRLWTIDGEYTLTKNAIRDLTAGIPRAKTILIAGGGSVGVEVAGEISYYFPGKDITILSGGNQFLPRLKNKKVGRSAELYLKSLRVKAVHGIKVTSNYTTSTGKTLLKLSDGSSKEVDIYIDATGGLPNTSFLPSEWLNTKGFVETDSETLRATKAPEGVYTIGDVGSYSKGGVLDVQGAVAPLGYSLWVDLSKDTKILPSPLREKKYAQSQKDMQIVPIGPKGGVGVLFGWTVPSFVVWMIKSRTFFFEKLPGLVNGDAYTKIDVAPM